MVKKKIMNLKEIEEAYLGSLQGRKKGRNVEIQL